jgi:hypothetical protein
MRKLETCKLGDLVQHWSGNIGVVYAILPSGSSILVRELETGNEHCIDHWSKRCWSRYPALKIRRW